MYQHSFRIKDKRPNPFTGEVDEPPTPVCPEEEMEDSTVNICCISYPSYSFKRVLDLINHLIFNIK
jgi:hypothetical protein